VIVVGGGDSALDAAVMALQRGATVQVIVREETPIGKSDTLNYLSDLGGELCTSAEIISATCPEQNLIQAVLNDGREIVCKHAIVQIGFLSAKETFEGLGLRLKPDGSIAIDPYLPPQKKQWVKFGMGRSARLW
jgi:thioredoxin reductase